MKRPTPLSETQTHQGTAADVHVRELQGWERGVAEHHAEETPKCPVLHPEHEFRKKWDLAQIVALVYVAFLVPCTLRAGVVGRFCAVVSRLPTLVALSSQCLMPVACLCCSPHRLRD